MRHFQRLTPNGVPHYYREVRRLKVQLADKELSSSARSKLKSRLGSLLLADEKTVQEGRDLLENCRGLEGRAEIVWSIRHATALQYSEEHLAAKSRFISIVHECRARDEYLDFALQHLGKCLAEMEHFNKARTCFEEALELRLLRGDPKLISSTQFALDELFTRRTSTFNDG